MNVPQKPVDHLPMSIKLTLAAARALGLDRLDAQLLLLHALGKPASDRAWLLAHDLDALPDSVNDAFMALAQRRLLGEPVAYLTRHKGFFGLDLHVDARVLVPRADTEALVEWALAVLDGLDRCEGPAARVDGCAPNSLARERALEVLDLGTGSGAVALAIKHSRPHVQVSATDFSTDALMVAQANAQRLQLEVSFSQGAWLDGIKGRYHVIASNPPYIAAGDPHLHDLAHEPLQALTSGDDGLDDIRTLIGQAPAHLHAGGWLLLEHGYNQAAAVRALLRHGGFDNVQSRRDLGGNERCSGGRWTGTGERTGQGNEQGNGLA